MSKIFQSLWWRISFLSALSIISAALVAAVSSHFVNRALVEQRMLSVRFVAESAGSIAKDYYDKAQSGALSEDEAKARAAANQVLSGLDVMRQQLHALETTADTFVGKVREHI